MVFCWFQYSFKEESLARVEEHWNELNPISILMILSLRIYSGGEIKFRG
jgi:hypothetical protein